MSYSTTQARRRHPTRRAARERDHANVSALQRRHAIAHPAQSNTATVMALQRTAGNRAVAELFAPTVQRFTDEKDTDGDEWRVSESKKSALWITKSSGGQALYASDDLVDDANKELKQAGTKGSHIRLDVSKTHGLKAGLLPGVGQLGKVTPRLAKYVGNASDPDNKKLRKINRGIIAPDSGTKGTDFALWSDCGRASRAVMGIGETGAGPKAIVRIGGTEKTTVASTDPSRFSDIVYMHAMPDFMRLAGSKTFLKRGVHKKWIGGKIIDPATPKQARKQYWELGDAGRRSFDTTVEVNTGANPKIGGAYTMATEYDMPGFKESGSTWNFHWAGVVMKDGDNNITLENYAVALQNDPTGEEGFKFVDQDWVFQMYGTKKLGQTFHEEHQATGTHGNRGSTFGVGPEGY